jgi:hypothetical protein
MRTELGLLKRPVLRILPNFQSVLCGVNKEVKENNNNNKKPNPILAFNIQTRGAQTKI